MLTLLFYLSFNEGVLGRSVLLANFTRCSTFLFLQPLSAPPPSPPHLRRTLAGLKNNNDSDESVAPPPVDEEDKLPVETFVDRYAYLLALFHCCWFACPELTRAGTYMNE